MGQGWHEKATKGVRTGLAGLRRFTMNPHQLFPLSTLQVSEEAEAILAEALQQHHAGRWFSISAAKSKAPWSEPISMSLLPPLPTGCLCPHTPVTLHCLGTWATQSHLPLGICPRDASMTPLPGSCYGLNYVPLKCYVEALTPNMTVFGDKAFREVIKAK